MTVPDDELRGLLNRDPDGQWYEALEWSGHPRAGCDHHALGVPGSACGMHEGTGPVCLDALNRGLIKMQGTELRRDPDCSSRCAPAAYSSSRHSGIESPASLVESGSR